MKNETKKEESGEVWETTKTEKKEEKNTRDEGEKRNGERTNKH